MGGGGGSVLEGGRAVRGGGGGGGGVGAVLEDRKGCEGRCPARVARDKQQLPDLVESVQRPGPLLFPHKHRPPVGKSSWNRRRGLERVPENG